MKRTFVLELQQELLQAGYDDAEIKYLSEDGFSLSIDLSFKGTVRKVGIEINEGSPVALYRIDGASLQLEFSSAKDLATQIFDRDPGTNSLPDFRKFTGLQ